MPIIQNNTLSSIVDLVSRANPIIKNPPLPYRETPFRLDSSGVAGFFGGESAVRATATVNLVTHRRWFGWYNAPGSYDLARQYSGLANARLFQSLFPSHNTSPANILMVDGQDGPEYTPLYSATNTAPSSIKHLGSLIARKVSQTTVRRGVTETPRVTFVRLKHTPDRELTELNLVPNSSVIIFGIITILASIGGCIGCILVADWFCLASIALGIFANGMACVAIGSGRLYLKHNSPAQTDAPGDVLLRTDTDVIVLVGTEGSVSPFTRGRFDLRFGEVPMPSKKHRTAEPTHPCQCNLPLTRQCQCNLPPTSQSHTRPTAPLSHFIPTFSQPRALERYLIDFSVILLLSQFLAQLLLIPQGTLFGQLMFVGTLLLSWLYNSYLSSLSLDFQTTMLFEKLDIHLDRIKEKQYTLENWTEAVVFTCLFFRTIHRLPEEVLKEGERGTEIAEMQLAEMQEAEKEAEEAKKEAEKAEKEAEKAEKEEAAREQGATTGDQGTATGAEMETPAKRARKAADDAEQRAANASLRKEKADEAQSKRDMVQTIAKIEHDSFRKLLDALFPDEKLVLQAFKGSLVRKISKTDVNPYAEDEKPPTFKFAYVDSFAEVGKGQQQVEDKDMRKLRTFWNDAEEALKLWRAYGKDVNTDMDL